MAEFNSSPNMGLPVPVVGIASGPLWATLIDVCLNALDAHDHTPGKGAAITPASININSPLTMANNPLTSIQNLQLLPQTTAPVTAGTIYESGNDLHFRDGNGIDVPITVGGVIAGSPGNITGLAAPASAIYAVPTFTWQSNTAVAANMDFGSAILRNITPNSTFALTLSPPDGLAINYAISLPLLPITTRVLSITSSGAMAAGATGVIVTADIADQNITTAKLADLNVTAAKIANATITGTQVSSNINLPGNSVQENGLSVAVGPDAGTSLKIVRGVVAGNASIVSGTGYTVTHLAAGTYNITYSTAFGDRPATTVTPDSATGADVIQVETSTSSSGVFRIHIRVFSQGLGVFVASDQAFSFTAIGSR